MGYNPWNSPGHNTGVDSLSFLQGIFPTQGLNPGFLHCRRILYQLSHKGSPPNTRAVLAGSPQQAWRGEKGKGCSVLKGIILLFQENVLLTLIIVRVPSNLPVFCSDSPDGHLSIRLSSFHNLQPILSP